jgi:hypothetical protein
VAAHGHDFYTMAIPAGGRDFVAAIGALTGETHAGQALETGTILQASGTAGRSAQGETVQG